MNQLQQTDSIARVSPRGGDDTPERSPGGLSRLTGIALGVLAGIGGFVDMGGVITSSQAGAQFRYALLWTLPVGVVGFAVYADMCGRIAIASGRTVFDVIRDRLGSRLALLPMLAIVVVNVLTLVVEMAGMALAVRLGLRLPLPLLVVAAAAVILLFLWRAGFEFMDNTAAVLGLTMLVSVAAVFVLERHWGHMAVSLVHPSSAEAHPVAGYLFLAVSLLGAYMTPYQFEFYSSGALEQRWTGKDLLTNRMSSLVGTVFGGVVVVGLIVTAAAVLYPQHHQVQTLADAALPVRTAFGLAGLVLFGVGVFAVSLGAGIETSLATGYTVCQFFGWEWGKRPHPRRAPLFWLVILAEFVVAIGIGVSGLDPISLTTLTMAFAAFSLPFTFLPILVVANDPGYVGDQKNTRAANVVAILVLVLLTVVTLATVPLLVLSGGGS